MITMQDIAESAQVSRGTVSYVLNGKAKKAKISKATSEKIFKVAETLGYRRNAIAQSMKTGKTNVIGVIGGLCESYSMAIIEGINDIVSKNSYMIKLFPAITVEEVKNVARQCMEQRLAGVICRSLSEEGLEILRKELVPNNIPIVLVDSSFSHNWCSRVISDDFEGAKLAVNYLYELGHRKISYVTTNIKRGFAKIRYEGFCTVMKEHSLDLLTHSVEIDDEFDEITDVFVTRVNKILHKHKPTAVFCGSDSLAMKVLKIATESGTKIPQELSIIGFAGMNYTQWTIPALTTINQPFVEMGKTATELLLSEIENKNTIQELKLPVKLIIRDSCQKI